MNDADAAEGEVVLSHDVTLAGAVSGEALSEIAAPPARVLTYAEARDAGILVVPTDTDDGHAHIAMREGSDRMMLLDLRRRIGRPLTVETVTAAAFETLLADHYGDADSLAAAEGIGLTDEEDALAMGLPTAEDLLDSADDAPAIRLINGLIAQGLREGASAPHRAAPERALHPADRPALPAGPVRR